MYKATEIEYKRVNQMRSSYERKFAWMLSALLNKQWRTAANSIDVTNYRSAVTGVVKRADTEKVIVNLYQSVGVSFARESYKRIKAREDEEMIDKWEQYMKQYARTDAGSRITSITQMTQAQIQRIVGGAVNRATDEGLGAVETAKAIRDSLREQGETINQWRALRIARTEVMTASNVGSLRGARDLGVPMNKIWIATLDDRTRDSHAAMNNVEVDINEDFKLPSGAVMDGPGDPAGGAEETINCRCSIAYRVKRGEVTGEREAGEGISITEPDIPESPERAVRETVEEFKPAATIKEAEEFIKSAGIAEKVDYTGFSIEQANAANKVLLANRTGSPLNKIRVTDNDELRALIGLDKGSKVGGVYRRSSNDMLLNYDLDVKLTEREIYRRSREYVKDNLDKWTEVYEYNLRNGTLTDEITAKYNSLKLRYENFVRSNAGYDTIEDTIAHEYGHKLHWNNKLTTIDSANAPLSSRIAGKPESRFGERYLSPERKEWFMKNISEYAGTNVPEAFAESYLAYQRGEKLPKWLTDIIEEVIRNAK